MQDENLIEDPASLFMDEEEITPVLSPPPLVKEEDPGIKEALDNFVAPSEDPLEALREFQAAAGLQEREQGVGDIRKPWMLAHEFVIVQSVEQLRGIVDSAILAGKCAIDLETEGLDNRIVFNSAGQPETVHKVVGYCLSVDGHTGFYVPVRHVGPAAEGNIKDVAGIEAEIRRLCIASQPVLSEAALLDNPTGGKQFLQPPQVILYFWYAKFDQEFLYPITGIGFWHPESFEDGLLAYFCLYTGDKMLSLKKKSPQVLTVRVTPDMAKAKTDDGERAWGLSLFTKEQFINAPYEMIELTDLFPKGKKKDIKWAELHPDEGRYYACSDAICTFLLCDGPAQKIIRNAKFSATYRIEKQTTQSNRKIERNRVLLDLGEVNKLFGEADVEAGALEAKVKDLAAASGFHDFDIRSPKQLGEFLFTERGLNLEPKPERNEASQQFKTDAETLDELAKLPEAPAVLVDVVKFRQIDKVKGTYLGSMSKNCPGAETRIPMGEARVNFKQTGAATGRFSAPGGEPDHGYGGFPVHGIPSTYDDKKPKVATALRKCFIARPGYLMFKVDYAAEELRIVTNLSGEPVWTKEFLEGTGDLHTITAKAFFGKEEVSKQERQMGKTSNFALVYGGGPMAVVRACGCTKEEGARRKQAFDKAVPTFAKWVKLQHGRVKTDLGVTSAFGRWMAVPDANSPDRAVQAACERHSLNYPIQSTGADIMKISMILLHREFIKNKWITDDGRNDIVRILLTIHDELVFEIRRDMLEAVVPVIRHCMEEPGRMVQWRVPLLVEMLIDTTWDAKYNWDHIWFGETGVKEDKKLKEWQFRRGDRVYGMPPFLKDSSGKWLINPPWVKDFGTTGGTGEEGSGSGEPTSPRETGETPQPQAAQTHQSTPPLPQPTTQAASPPKFAPKALTLSAVVPEDVFVWKICMGAQNKKTVRCILAAVDMTASSSGKVLHVLSHDNKTLVDPRWGIRVDTEYFRYEMQSKNL